MVATPQAAVEQILEIVEAEAAQLRLKLDGGWPWETFQTERTIYRAQHHDGSAKSKALRTLSMLPALALPPRWFYRGRQRRLQGAKRKVECFRVTSIEV